MNTIDPAKTLRLLWTCREAAAALNLSERTLWSLTKAGGLPCVRIGRSVRYDPADIRAWIEAQKSMAQPPETSAELS
jgi:excisionase family DNA binding protein